MSEEQGIAIELPQLARIEALLERALEGRTRQAWYTLEQAWRLKHAAAIQEGAISLKTFAKTRAYQPRGGVADKWVSNRKVWSEETIEEWLGVGDDDLGAYLEKHNPGVKVPDRIFEAVKRRRSS
jgi:hypothetical protein